MIRQELRRLPTTPRKLRQFSLVVGGVFLAIGGSLWWRGNAHFPYFLIPGGSLIVSGVLAPRILKAPYLAWMALAYALGFFVSTALLTLFFYLVVTPIGLAARLSGKDFLRRKLDRNSESYWILRDRSKPKDRRAYELQF